MSVPTLAPSQIDVGGIATDVIDTGAPDGPAGPDGRPGPPVLCCTAPGPA